MGKRKRTLLSEEGILHLKSSFVHPQDASGLLNTVGGRQEQPLVLASGNYGYGIPVSVALKAAEAAQAQADEEQDPDVQMVREINGGVYSAAELIRDRTGASDKINADGMSVAELVRSIGGARDAPLRRCDVVEDRLDIIEQQAAAAEGNGAQGGDVDMPDPQADEFYASIGLPNPNENLVPVDETSNEGQDYNRRMDQGERDAVTESGSTANEGQSRELDPNVTASVADYYKTYTQYQYYYSKESNPYGDQRLEFGLPIDSQDGNAENGGGETIIQLARMAQIRARQAKAAADALEKAKRAKALKPGNVEPENEADMYDPLPMEIVESAGTAEELGITVDTNLEQYWEFVKQDPHDFNRWVYLIQYAESTNCISNCREVYSAFLPLFSYCFGYWKRYSEMEKSFGYYGRALTILKKGLEFIPLSADLWLAYLALFCEMYAHEPSYKEVVRDEYEKALNTCGMDFRSDSLWDAFIQWETENKKLKNALSLYGRVLQVPTRLYNRHWDNVKALIRDHHPRDFLEHDEYEYLKKQGCKELKLRYREEPEYPNAEICKPSKPEDKLMTYVKEKVLEKLAGIHEKCEIECNKRWDYEDKIKRPYFHTKPLDRRQLRNWIEYLDFEIAEGNHDRVVLLFERCVISCAQYESFWCKYARYLENYHKKNTSSSQEISVHFLKVQENLEIGTKKATEEEENRIEDVKHILNELVNEVISKAEKEQQELAEVVDSDVVKVVPISYEEKREIAEVMNNVIVRVSSDTTDEKDSSLAEWSLPYVVYLNDNITVELVGTINVTNEETMRRGQIASPKLSGDSDASGLPVKSGEQDSNNESSSSGFSTLISVPQFPPAKYVWQEAVRDVYKRACVVHCPRKPVIRLQWAAFEEELGNSKEARDLILHVQEWFPGHFEAKLHLLELERRCGNHDAVIELSEKYLKHAKSIEEHSILSMKFSRFLHKEAKSQDKALRVLKNAIRKDKENTRLYNQVLEICYEQYPTKKRPTFAALDIALNCPGLSEDQRLIFLRKKLLYEQEHGEIKGYRDTLDKLTELEEVVRKRKAVELNKKEEEARLTVGTMNPYLMPFPVPDASAAANSADKSGQKPVPIEYENVGNSPLPPMPEEHEIIEEKEPDVSAPFKKVAPPAELNMDNYGYSSKHPDYKIAEFMAQKEYEQLESKGYPEHLLDKEGDKVSRKRKAPEEEGPVYIVQPKSATMYLSCPGTSNLTTTTSIASSIKRKDGKEPEIIELEAPQQLSAVAVPSTSPCINVPDWFVKDGGELCLSETRAGFSVIRYWPKFLNETGGMKMYKAIRRAVKWHQKQRVVWDKWRYIPRLVSWLGPCDWADRGMELKKNEDWPPEVLDLLHRINQITQHEFNSCFLNLYRTGHDSHPWHGDVHPAYGANPPVATISLGSLRLFEMKRRGPVSNFIRFPLFPGSLLIMEGACQEDWSHQIPKDPKVEGERISLVFRVMHAIETPEKGISNPSDKETNSDKENLSKNKNNAISSNADSSKNKSNGISSIVPASDEKSKPTPVEKSSSNVAKKDNDPKVTASSSNNDSEIEILEVKKPSQTRIIFHNKK